MVTIKSKREIEQMKEACKLTAQVHEVLKEAAEKVMEEINK